MYKIYLGINQIGKFSLNVATGIKTRKMEILVLMR